MKLQFNAIPKQLASKFDVCCYGEIDKSEIPFPCNIEYKDGYTNIKILDFNLEFEKFEYMDGFSPNLNKKLHVGHLSNLVYAKALQSLNIAKKYIAIYGDCLENNDYKNENFNSFGYFVDKKYYASLQTLKDNSILIDGKGKYEGTLCFNIKDKYYVGIKSDKKTSYLYQDIALIQTLNGKTLYVTGSEQSNHFAILKEYSDNVCHLPLGLVTLDGKKMSSREGNVIFIDDLFSLLKETLINEQLAYNVIAGKILMSSPTSTKNINVDTLNNVKTSQGLYVSYSLARLNNLPISFEQKEVSPIVKYIIYKSKLNIDPSYAFKYLIEICKEFNKDYETKKAINNISVYSQYKIDIEILFKSLGLYLISKI